MNEILFLIVALLILCFITGMRMLINAWGKKYRYKSSWDLLYTDDKSVEKRKQRGLR
ncbi:hypothetical protein [Metabacillus malikii]|uniref:DUF3951 domain-containing protein n=1 Tax=Metabacillus malikii TaxID=1504265 RepID=A0ABT9ZNM0_9BACI|nr:hypothetical protein [Metabacillus malikii]MDQ0233509.1 hypothetical protein [Metabacillus malikii]